MEPSTWLENQLIVASVCGAGAGLMTLARRGAMPTKQVKRMAGWKRWRHSLSGFCLAAGVGTGAALLSSDHLKPMNRIGLTLLISACYDIATSEGLAYIARIYLRRKQDDESEDDEDLPDKWKNNGKP